MLSISIARCRLQASPKLLEAGTVHMDGRDKPGHDDRVVVMAAHLATGYVPGGKKTSMRTSRLSRGGAPGGVVGSSKPVWAEKRAAPERLES